MPAYLITETVVTDPVAYEDYKRLSGPALAAYGGRFIVRGGAVDTIEGDWRPNRLVVAEFPDAAAARRFYDSPEYAAARKAREGAAIFKMVLVEGA